MIPIAKPYVGQGEIDLVNQVLSSGMLAQGPKTEQLEKDFAAYCGTKYAVAVNSGTAAIHAALYAAGIREGDEVITVPFSFIATVNPIIMLGAKPVFVDVNSDDFLMDVSQIESKITSKTKAIMPVHLYGQIANMNEINRIANEKGLVVIEDACQAIGAEYDGRKAGSLGTAGCFSLYATKNIMCGEGGVITTDDENLARIARQFRQHGMSGPYQYEHLGYNYRITDLCAAIAIVQLQSADTFNAARQLNADRLTSGLKNTAGIRLPFVHEGRTHVYHQYTIILEDNVSLDREALIVRLREKNISTGVYYPKALHAIPHIGDCRFAEGDFPVAEKLAATVLSLPVHPLVSKEEIDQIVDAVKGILSDK